MTRKFLWIMLVALMAIVLPQRESHSVTGYDVESFCPETQRVDHTYATCLTGSWDNSESGTTYAVQNNCSSYGHVHAMILTSGSRIKDWILDIDHGNEYKITLKSGSTTGITCCFDRSDLCWKSQVEADDQGRIRQVTITSSGSDATSHYVATHQQRYDFCQAYPNDIYCDVNPSGDALTEPTGTRECGGVQCTVQDCRDNFADSPATGSPGSCTDLSIVTPEWNNPGESRPETAGEYPLNDNNCRVSHATCTNSDGEEDDNVVMHKDDGRGGSDDVNIQDMDDILYCEFEQQYNNAIYTRERLVDGDACPEDDTY